MKMILVIATMMATMAAHAQNRIVSIDAFDMTYTGGLLFKSDKGKGDVKNKNETNFRFNLNYAQNWDRTQGLMWKAAFHFNREDIKGDVKTLNSNFGLSGGLLYNFEANDIKNSPFAGAMVGLDRSTFKYGSEDDSAINFLMFFEGGKRWDLGRYAKIDISYAPSASFQWKRYGGDIRKNFYKSGTELKLNFLKFDVLF